MMQIGVGVVGTLGWGGWGVLKGLQGWAGEKYRVGVSGVLRQAEKPTKGSASGTREEDIVNKNE